MRRAFDPFWLHVPKLLSLASRTGRRRRGLQRAQARLAALADIRHHA